MATGFVKYDLLPAGEKIPANGRNGKKQRLLEIQVRLISGNQISKNLAHRPATPRQLNGTPAEVSAKKVSPVEGLVHSRCTGQFAADVIRDCPRVRAWPIEGFCQNLRRTKCRINSFAGDRIHQTCRITNKCPTVPGNPVRIP